MGRIGELMDDDYDDDFHDDWTPPDVVCQRADALRDLAVQVDNTKDKQARLILLRAMERITDFLVEPKDNVRKLHDRPLGSHHSAPL